MTTAPVTDPRSAVDDDRFPRGRRELAALLGIAVAVALFFLPVWGGGMVFVSDGQLAAFFGPIALWSDAWIGGWPVGADAASYVFYPLRWLLRPIGSFDLFGGERIGLDILGAIRREHAPLSEETQDAGADRREHTWHPRGMARTSSRPGRSGCPFWCPLARDTAGNRGQAVRGDRW